MICLQFVGDFEAKSFTLGQGEDGARDFDGVAAYTYVHNLVNSLVGGDKNLTGPLALDPLLGGAGLQLPEFSVELLLGATISLVLISWSIRKRSPGGASPCHVSSSA